MLGIRGDAGSTRRRSCGDSIGRTSRKRASGESARMGRLPGGEPVDSGGLISFAGLQFGGGEARMIGRIGVVLGLHAEGAAADVGVALALERAVEEVGGVELQGGLGG